MSAAWLSLGCEGTARRPVLLMGLRRGCFAGVCFLLMGVPSSRQCDQRVSNWVDDYITIHVPLCFVSRVTGLRSPGIVRICMHVFDF